jgi:hypothetical protein
MAYSYKSAMLHQQSLQRLVNLILPHWHLLFPVLCKHNNNYRRNRRKRKNTQAVNTTPRNFSPHKGNEPLKCSKFDSVGARVTFFPPNGWLNGPHTCWLALTHSLLLFFYCFQPLSVGSPLYLLSIPYHQHSSNLGSQTEPQADNLHLVKLQHTLLSIIGQNHIYTVYIRYFWQGNYEIYGHIQCIYTVLANPTFEARGANPFHTPCFKPLLHFSLHNVNLITSQSPTC